jgi:DNA-directed RNA polymerase specialized sigma24 family protein
MSVYTLEDLRRQFEDRYETLRAIAMKQVGRQSSRSKREDLADTALAMAWKYVRRSWVTGKVNDADSAWFQSRMAVKWAVKHAFKGMTLETTTPTEGNEAPGNRNRPRGVPKLDAYDKGLVASREEMGFFSGVERDPTADRARFSIDIMEFMATLTDHQRRFVMAILTGHPNEELARIFGVKIDTIYGNKKVLRELFNTYFKD